MGRPSPPTAPCPLPQPVLRCEWDFIFIEIQGVEIWTVLQKQLLSLLLLGLFPAGRREPTSGVSTAPGHPALSLDCRDHHQQSLGMEDQRATLPQSPCTMAFTLRFWGAEGRDCIAWIVLSENEQTGLKENSHHTTSNAPLFVYLVSAFAHCLSHQGLCLALLLLLGSSCNDQARAPCPSSLEP